MRRVKWFAGVLMLIIVCSPAFSQSVEGELDALVDTWVRALSEAEIEPFMDCYWDDAIRMMYSPGQAQMDEGAAQIRSVQLDLFEQRNFAQMDFPYDPTIKLFPDGGNPTYFLANSAWTYMEVFEFERRIGMYRIIRQYVLPHPVGE